MPDTALSQAFERAGLRHPAQRLEDAAMQALKDAGRSAVDASGMNIGKAVQQFEKSLRADGEMLWALWGQMPGKREESVVSFLRRVADGARKEAGARGHRDCETQGYPAPAPAKIASSAAGGQMRGDAQKSYATQQQDGGAGHSAIGTHTTAAGPSVSHASAGMRALNAAAARTIFDTHLTPIGKLLGDCTRDDLLGLADRATRDAWFYRAAANGLPPTDTPLRLHKTPDEVEANWAASRKLNDA